MEEEIQNKESGTEKTEVTEKPLDRMTAPELREIAKEIPGVAGTHAMKKDELLKIIKEHRGIKDEAPEKKKKKKTGKPMLSAKQMKQKIIQLREEKKKARDGKDPKKVTLLRRRINRLKKRTRKVVNA